MDTKNIDLEQDPYIDTEDIDMIKMFDDCEAGFLAKKSKIPAWLIFVLS